MTTSNRFIPGDHVIFTASCNACGTRKPRTCVVVHRSKADDEAEQMGTPVIFDDDPKREINWVAGKFLRPLCKEWKGDIEGDCIHCGERINSHVYETTIPKRPV